MFDRQFGLVPIGIIFLVAIIALAAGFIAFTRGGQAGNDLEKVLEVYEKLLTHHVDQEAIDPEALSVGAINGMIAVLDDPFTGYFDTRGFEQVIENIQGEFAGIGIQVSIIEGAPTIVDVIPETPAQRIGLQPQDVLIEVDGKSLEGLTLEEVVQYTRGEPGTIVNVRIFRRDISDTLDFEIVRDLVKYVTVRVDDIDEGMARIRISKFGARTGKEVERALKQLTGSGVKGIILDLRNNPGGLLEEVVLVASEFLDQGIVLYEINGKGERREWDVEEGGLYQTGPMIVMVNGGSASGSEVLAAAIQSTGRALVVGQKTFGKGVVNVPFELNDGSGLYVTIARWYTPKGHQIGDIGVIPDVVLTNGAGNLQKKRDMQLEKATEILKSKIEDNNVRNSFKG